MLPERRQAPAELDKLDPAFEPIDWFEPPPEAYPTPPELEGNRWLGGYRPPEGTAVHCCGGNHHHSQTENVPAKRAGQVMRMAKKYSLPAVAGVVVVAIGSYIFNPLGVRYAVNPPERCVSTGLLDHRNNQFIELGIDRVLRDSDGTVGATISLCHVEAATKLADISPVPPPPELANTPAQSAAYLIMDGLGNTDPAACQDVIRRITDQIVNHADYFDDPGNSRRPLTAANIRDAASIQLVSVLKDGNGHISTEAISC